MKHANVSVKIMTHPKKDYSWNFGACTCENSKYLTSIANDSKIVCDQIINAICSVLTNVSTHFHKKKVRN